MLAGNKPCQIAYYVPDIREAALQHHRLFGSGPFFVAESIDFTVHEHRGVRCEWDQSSSFGYWGDVMVEFMVQNKPGRSVLEDVMAVNSAPSGMHHVGYYVDDPAATVAGFGKIGCPQAMRAVLANGIEVFMVDTIGLYGHMIELYEPTATLMDLHGFIRQAAQDFDGTDPVREFSL